MPHQKPFNGYGGMPSPGMPPGQPGMQQPGMQHPGMQPPGMQPGMPNQTQNPQMNQMTNQMHSMGLNTNTFKQQTPIMSSNVQPSGKYYIL